MPKTFATVWLARGALVAAAVFVYCAWKVYTLDRRSKPNRVAVVFNLIFALWAAAASFWYAADSAASALVLYRALAWTWCVFPPLMLHFTMRVAGCPVLDSRWHRVFFGLMYLPSIILAILLPNGVLADPVYRGGYWMLAVRVNTLYFLFVIHYFLFVLASISLAFLASARANNRRTRRRLALIGWSYLTAGLLGFVTDTVFLYFGIDFPNMAIIWILILSMGMLLAMGRYGFLSLLPAREALAVLESMAGFVIYLDDSGRVIWGNASAIRAMGAANLEQARQLEARDFLSAEIAAQVTRSSRNDSEPRGYRTSLGPKAVPVSLRVHPVARDGSEGTVLTGVDLRPEFAKVRIERRLADAGLLLDEFMARSLDGIVLTDTGGRIVRWNAPMETITGIEAEAALGAFYWDLRATVEPDGGREPEHVRKSLLAVMAGHEPSWARRIVETEIRRRDGTRRVIQNDSFPIPLAEGTILATIARDVTEERRQAGENIERIRKLDHAQKMEAVGTLSGGIAHDFNNTLAGIIGAVSLIRQGIDTGSIRAPGDMLRELDIIEKSADRAASSVKRLLTLTRKRSPESVPFRLDESLRHVAEFAERSVDHSVNVELQPDLPEAVVNGDQGQMEQLVLNLMINAEHAMTIMRPRGQPQGGPITLAIASFMPNASFLSANPGVDNREYWAVSVRDEGVGIPRHIQNRIFDPFYTTKPSDKSSGLGLAMVHAIARQHGGFVELRSEPGAGAEFIVYLPCSSMEEKASPDGLLARRWTGLVLVADDDDIPRETAAAILEAIGFQVVTASGGIEAVTLFGERPAEWVAAVLDMRMGDFGGIEVAERLWSIRPDLPVVLASGLHDEDAETLYQSGSAFSILDKPYTITELGEALDKAIGKDQG